MSLDAQLVFLCRCAAEHPDRRKSSLDGSAEAGKDVYAVQSLALALGGF
jgi:hypothetical protein